MLSVLVLLGSAGPAAALVTGTQCRATVPSLVARPSVRCCAVEEAVVEEAPPSCDFPGCDGRGRALGGLGAIPLFSWWPIKAYRPCPTCAAKGMKYSRSGQTLDEIVFKKNPAGGYYGEENDP